MKRFPGIKYVTAGLLFLAACFVTCKKNKNDTSTPIYSGGDGSTTGGGGTGGGYGDSTHTSFPVTQVYVFNYHFSPTDITIARGYSVSWTNRDSISHTVSSVNGVFDSGDLGPGKNYFISFQNTGIFYYHCRYHKEGGKITVY